LSESDVNRIATRVVERLHEQNPPTPARWLTAAEVADLLGVSRGTVYERAKEFGVARIGNGPKPRLRFDRELVIEAASCSESKGHLPRKRLPRLGIGRELEPTESALRRNCCPFEARNDPVFWRWRNGGTGVGREP
jgi:hypothetical protein